MKSRRQALQLCLDAAVVIVIEIVNELLLEVFHRFKGLQIEKFTLEQAKKFSITALSRQFPFRLMLCRTPFFWSIRRYCLC